MILDLEANIVRKNAPRAAGIYKIYESEKANFGSYSINNIVDTVIPDLLTPGRAASPCAIPIMIISLKLRSFLSFIFILFLV